MNFKPILTQQHSTCKCFIIPQKVLIKLSKDKSLSEQTRESILKTLQFESEWRQARKINSLMSISAQKNLPSSLKKHPILSPSVEIYSCNHYITLPGTLIRNPNDSTDLTCTQAFKETTAVVEFYNSVFGRNSIDDAGMTLNSSIHYGDDYNNAFWNGYQMTYGDGDGEIFLDFTKSIDVICHELTHGITQYTLGLNYEDQPGGLNESISDVFGSMFRQWRLQQNVNQADWLIGKEIMGPDATTKGYTCLRDLSNPAAKHCLSPQPIKFSQYHNGMDPHDSSGIPNFAFYNAALAIGGNSWEVAGKIWYKTLTEYGPAPNMTMKQFANHTRMLASSLYPSKTMIQDAVDYAWKRVGL